MKNTKTTLEKEFRQAENSEWGPVAAQFMCDETKNIPITLGNGKMTLADIFDRTPMDRTSLVMLEEKLFKTWYHGRTVLLGDGKSSESFTVGYTFLPLYFGNDVAANVNYTKEYPPPLPNFLFFTFSVPQVAPSRRPGSHHSYA